MQSTRKRAAAQEKKLARQMGGKVQPGSGSNWYAKGDVKATRYMVECKFTDKQQYILKASDVDKARRAALFEGKQWAMQVTIAGRPLVIMDADALLELEERGST